MVACPGVNKDGRLCPYTAKCSRFLVIIIKSMHTHWDYAPVKFITNQNGEQAVCGSKIDKSTEL